MGGSLQRRQVPVGCPRRYRDGELPAGGTFGRDRPILGILGRARAIAGGTDLDSSSGGHDWALAAKPLVSRSGMDKRPMKRPRAEANWASEPPAIRRLGPKRRCSVGQGAWYMRCSKGRRGRYEGQQRPKLGGERSRDGAVEASSSSVKCRRAGRPLSGWRWQHERMDRRGRWFWATCGIYCGVVW